MNGCLFCNSDGPFSKIEHIIPEALGNNDLILSNEVCDKCNQFFGSKIERFVLEKTPIAFWRTFLGIKTKKNNLPQVDLSQPRNQKGRLPSVHGHHDNRVGFTCHEDNSVSADIDNDQIVQDILAGKRNQLKFVLTPDMLSKMGRFFLKVGLELLCFKDSQRARADEFAQARRFARFGDLDGLWPIFHLKYGSLSDVKKRFVDSKGVNEEVFCYNYSLLEFEDKYLLSVLTVGTDRWFVCLNSPEPAPVFSIGWDDNLKLIWYGPEEIKRS